METLALWRNILLVYLIILTIPCVAIPGIALFFAQKYLRLGRKKLRLPLRTIQIWANRIEKKTDQVARRAIEVPIAAQANVTRVKATVNAIRKEFG